MNATNKTNFKGKAGITGAVLAVILLAMSLIKPWEGRKNYPYRDVVGVLTVCDGHTGSDIQMRNYTDAECDVFLQNDVQTANDHVRRCITYPLPAHVESAFTSATYNAGPKLVCGSTLQRKANAGDLAGACVELSRWIYAGGRVWKGLVNRRAAERRMCEGGLK